MKAISLTNPAFVHPLAKFLPVVNSNAIHHTLPTQASYYIDSFTPARLLDALTYFLTTSSKITCVCVARRLSSR
jgi:hypothetical protein